MFQDIIFKETVNSNNDDDILIRINRELVTFLRNGMRCSHILVGRKDYLQGLACDLDIDEETKSEPKTYSMQIVAVDEDSYFAGAYIPDKGE